jgi:hypothetical protein
LLIWAFGVLAQANQIILVPLDSRPASGQFAQMIGKVAAVDVRMPPYEYLGRFTSPGNPEAILKWLEGYDMSQLTAVVVSTDMLAYGGLIESRTNTVSYDRAWNRMERLIALKRKWPKLKIYAFSSVMRLTPTATRKAAPWRMSLAKFMELEDRTRRVKEPGLQAQMNASLKRVPSSEITRYRDTRWRNHKLQRALVDAVQRKELDYVVFGQDDAKKYGPHVPENRALLARVTTYGLGGKVFFCEGVDQLSNMLVSRAVLRQADVVPRIRIVYSDEEAAKKYAFYESKPIFRALQDQILAAGARPAKDDKDADYTLYVNAPDPNDDSFSSFTHILGLALDQGMPVAVADINLGGPGLADPRVFETIMQGERTDRILAYAGWNTAGNTLGTVIPAANMAMLARQGRVPDRMKAEVARCEFLLHRLVNDFAYHHFTRPQAYRLIDSIPGASREETDSQSLASVNRFVQRDLAKYLRDYFTDQFQGMRLEAGGSAMTITSLDAVKVWLPWPRAYEVRLEFKLGATAIPTNTGTAQIKSH